MANENTTIAELQQKIAQLEQYNSEHSESGYDQLISLTLAQLVNIRDKERALHGSEECASFSGNVGTNSTAYFVSKEITSPFSVSELEATFDTVPSGGTAPRVYFLVANDNAQDASGFNLLSDYSQASYFTGNGQRIKAIINPKEFRSANSSQYLKVYIVNSDSTNSYNLNARITIKVYPQITQSIS